ncbi:MAG: hypothetical protein PHY95_03895 [Candidatus ainarchaeum sp.]|nr:hypothetical protein [Candidatus ainarchaeum sp.]
MRLLAESLAAAFIALFVLNFLGLSVSMLASVTSFFVVLLVIVLIEEKSGFSSRAILKKYRLDRPIIATAIVFGLLFVLAIVFSIINTRLSAIITPFINSLESTIGLIGLVIISALAYRLFYHFMYQEIELDTGLELVKKVRTKIGGR